MKKTQKQKTATNNNTGNSFKKLKNKPKISLTIVIAIVVLFGGIGAYLLFRSKAETPTEFKGYYMFGAVPSTTDKSNITHPLVAGWGMAGIHWNDVQNNDGTYNWTKIDQTLAALESTEVKNANGGKPKNLLMRIIIGQTKSPVGATSPINCAQTTDSDGLEDQIPRYTWCGGARPNGQTRPGAKFYTWQDSDNKTGSKYQAFIPLFWDQSFQADWKDFVGAMGARYGNRANVSAMVTGPYKVFGENFLPFCPADQKSKWFELYNRDFSKSISTDGNNAASTQIIQDEYTKFLKSYLLSTFANSFDNAQPMAIGTGLGACDSDNAENTKFYTQARQTYGGYGSMSPNNRGWFIQFNGLGPSYANESVYTNKMIKWISDNWSERASDPSRRGVIGYQTVGGTDPFCKSAQCITNANFDKTIKNAVDLKASYVEVYNTDFSAAINYDRKNTAYSNYTQAQKDGAKVIYDTLSKYQSQLVSTVKTSTTPPSDTTKPTVSVTAPKGGAKLSGSSTTLSATASDNVGVTKVELMIDNSVKATDDSTPYSTAVDTTSLSNGSHSITAKAYDAAGNTTTSSAVSVTVDNTVTPPPPPPPPPPTTLSAPTNFSILARNFVTTTGFNLQWDPVQDATNYNLYRNGSLLNIAQMQKNTANKITAYDNTAQGLTGYTYSVSAVDNTGKESARSNSDYGRCDWFLWWFCK